MAYTLYRYISFAASIYTFILFIRVIISWIRVDPFHPAVQVLYRLTEPVLQPIRKVLLSRIGNFGLDFSPIVALILLRVLMSLLRWVLFN